MTLTAAITSKSTRERTLGVRGPYALASQYVHFKMHGEYDGGATIVEDDSPDAIFRDITPNSVDWSTQSGWNTGVTVGGNGKNITPNAAEQAFLRSDTINDGSILINAWVQLPDAATTTQAIFCYGKMSEEGYVLNIDNSYNLWASHKGNGVAANAKSQDVMSPGQFYNVGAIYDFTNLTVTCWINGVMQGGPTTLAQLTDLPATNKYGFLLTSNGTAGFQDWGETITTTTYESLISDLMVIRFETDVSDQFLSIMDGFWRSPRGTIPAVLDGL